MFDISNFERFHRNFVPFLAQIYRVLLLSRLPKYKRNGIPPRKDFLLDEEKDVFETRNTRHHDLPRAIDSDWIRAGEEDVLSDVHFDLFETRREKMDTRSSSTRRDTENWAARKIPSLFGGKEKGIHSFGNWTPPRRKEISLPLNLRGKRNEVSAKVSSPTFSFPSSSSFFISFVASLVRG